MRPHLPDSSNTTPLIKRSDANDANGHGTRWNQRCNDCFRESPSFNSDFVWPIAGLVGGPPPLTVPCSQAPGCEGSSSFFREAAQESNENFQRLGDGLPENAFCFPGLSFPIDITWRMRLAGKEGRWQRGKLRRWD